MKEWRGNDPGAREFWARWEFVGRKQYEGYADLYGARCILHRGHLDELYVISRDTDGNPVPVSRQPSDIPGVDCFYRYSFADAARISHYYPDHREGYHKGKYYNEVYAGFRDGPLRGEHGWISRTGWKDGVPSIYYPTSRTQYRLYDWDGYTRYYRCLCDPAYTIILHDGAWSPDASPDEDESREDLDRAALWLMGPAKVGDKPIRPWDLDHNIELRREASAAFDRILSRGISPDTWRMSHSYGSKTLDAAIYRATVIIYRDGRLWADGHELRTFADLAGVIATLELSAFGPRGYS